MYTHDLSSELISIGPVTIHYYGLVYFLAFAGTYWWLMRNRSNLGLNKDQVADVVLYAVLGMYVGARLVALRNVILDDPLEFFRLWHGGMNFYGGLIGATLVGWWYAQREKINFWEVADVITPVLLVALFLGRIANFINAEIVGSATDVAWCVDFPGYVGCRHPYQLYAAGSYVVIAIILYFIRGKRRINSEKLRVKSSNSKFQVSNSGRLFLSFIWLYAFSRFFLDFLKEDSRYLFGWTMWQWVSGGVVVLVSLVAWHRLRSLRALVANERVSSPKKTT